MDPKAISIVIPTYNRCQYLKGLLDCLLSQNYTIKKYEIIIVNDGSTDNTGEYVKTLVKEHSNLRLINQKNKGPAGARNAGIKTAKYEIVAFTDDDCRPKSDWLKKISEYFTKNLELLGVGGIMYTPADQIKVLTHHSLPLERAKKEQAPFPGTNNVAYRKTALKKVKGFDETFEYVSTEDVDLFIRISKIGKVIFDPELAMLHISRPIDLKYAIKGYKNFYFGFKEIERKYPEEFKKIYGKKTTNALLGSHSNIINLLKQNLRYYFPDILNPITFFKVVWYYLATRLFLLRESLRKK